MVTSFMLLIPQWVLPNRVTTCLENLEMAGNLKPIIRELSGNFAVSGEWSL